jgi:hypothetical protein
MRSAKPYAFRLSSKPCSTREDLRGLKARIEAALRNTRNLYSAALKTTEPAALQHLEEELKQTSVAHRLICYAVHAHLTINTPRNAVSAWRPNGPGKES